MTLRSFLQGTAQKDESAVSYLRSRGVLETSGNATCTKKNTEEICGSHLSENCRIRVEICLSCGTAVECK